jgi:hypothetical protein
LWHLVGEDFDLLVASSGIWWVGGQGLIGGHFMVMMQPEYISSYTVPDTGLPALSCGPVVVCQRQYSAGCLRPRGGCSRAGRVVSCLPHAGGSEESLTRRQSQSGPSMTSCPPQHRLSTPHTLRPRISPASLLPSPNMSGLEKALFNLKVRLRARDDARGSAGAN